MIKEIQYKGYATEPSDYECPDGQLATSLNLINEDNQLKPVFQPSERAELPDGYKIVFIHKTASFVHYILLYKIQYEGETYYECRLRWVDSSVIDNAASFPVPAATITSNLNAIPHLYDNSPKLTINAVGNTLVVLEHGVAIHYILWGNNAYKYLGTHLPEIKLSFGLQGHPLLFSAIDSSHSTFTISFNAMSPSSMLGEWSEDNQNTITEQIMAKVNKFLAEQTVNKGRFAFPFFVRYALRLYDGSLTMHSAPVLMNPCTTNNPIVYWKEAYNSSSSSSVNRAVCDMMLVAADLDYKYSVMSDDLDNWKDIVKSVDVFISKPIYPYDQNGKIKSCKDADDFDSVFIGKLYATGGSSSVAEDKYLTPVANEDFLNIYSQWEYSQIYALYHSTDRSVPWAVFKLPEFSGKKNAETLRNTSTFYKLCSIDINDLTTTRKVIDIEDDYIGSLVTREAMTDDCLSHDQLDAKFSYVYNQRLNLAGITRTLFKGFSMYEMLAFCNRRFDFSKSGTTITITPKTSMWDRYTVIVYIKENGEDMRVICNGGYFDGLQNFFSDEHTKVKPSGASVTENSKESWGCYFFYPNPNAYKMVIVSMGEGSYVHSHYSYEIKLKAHDFLNGAYALLDYGIVREHGSYFNGSTDDQTEAIHIPNKNYTSEVNNPFYFPALGINTIGTGTILGISAAAKAMSQGQFGQFPLYAFTTEGVWALEVSSTGSYSARQPITRDVCINTGSITQIDSSVLFATDRGIMLISGSQTQCITDGIFSEAPFNVLDLPGIDQLHAKLGHSADACLPMQPFLGFLAGCQMVYDYVHQRIFVYNPTKVNGSPKYTYAYVFSLKSKMWGMVFTNLASTINAYPEALAMTLDNKLVSFSETDEEVCKGLYITRPLKLEAADVHKTISALIQRGHFQRGDVGTVLYGSRDLFSWHLVWSSKDHYLRGFRGTPYKYFRIAGLATLTDGKSIFGASVNFEPRHTNQLR